MPQSRRKLRRLVRCCVHLLLLGFRELSRSVRVVMNQLRGESDLGIVSGGRRGRPGNRSFPARTSPPAPSPLSCAGKFGPWRGDGTLVLLGKCCIDSPKRLRLQGPCPYRPCLQLRITRPIAGQPPARYHYSTPPTAPLQRRKWNTRLWPSTCTAPLLSTPALP
eukprot:7784250-Pyramimonas_sp.AAC.2